MRVGLMTDYPSPSVQSGPAIHTRYLYERLMKRGHEVTLMGPDTGDEVPIGSARVHLYRGIPYPTHPKVKIPLPGSWKTMWNAPEVDVVHSQTNTHMVKYAGWLRELQQTAVLNTHTVHLPTHSHFVLSDKLYARETVRKGLRRWADKVERDFAQLYNEGDCLIVQSSHFVDYWRERGVTVPIEVQGRPIDPAKFSRRSSHDPFAPAFRRGKRLLVVCRQDREKSLDRLLTIFDQHIAPHDPDVTLTLVGDGHDRENLQKQAERLESRARIHFPGEVAHSNLVDWYRNGDVFVYTSVSETFGNVVNEALWCGMPVVALEDGMGVSHQVVDGENGFLVRPGRSATDGEFASHALNLMRDDVLRRRMGEQARDICLDRSHPDRVVARYEGFYERAREHARLRVPVPLREQAGWRQRLSLAKCLAVWTYWNRSLLTLAHVATAIGAGRKVLVQRQLAAPSEAPSQRAA